LKVATGAATTKEAEMRFLIAMHADEGWMETATPEEIEEMIATMEAYNKQLQDAGVMLTGEGLAPSAQTRTLRFGTDGKAVVTDGPFAETKEQLAGYWIFECKDIDEAVEWTKKGPLQGATVEVRQIVDTAEENVDLYKEQAEQS
jgi:hypothetical protein